MPLVKIQTQPGINREVTNYAAKGTYVDGNKIRFRWGYPQKLGGWVRYTTSSFSGVVRTLFNWVTYAQESLLAVGTNQRYYVENSSDQLYHPITPVNDRNVNYGALPPTYGTVKTITLGSNPIATVSGKTWVTITDSGFNSTVGTFVTFAGATAVNGITILGSYEIVAILTSTTYVIQTNTTASGTGSGGGAAVTVVYDINAGNAIYSAVTTSGFGAGGFGTGGFGTSTGSYVSMNLWSQSNWGQDLIMAQRNGPIYYWAKDTSTYTPAVSLHVLAESTVKTTKTLTANAILGATSIVVSDTLSIDPGSIVISGTAIPADTYVLTSWDGSNTIPLSAALTAPLSSGATVTFSYSGNTSPTQTLQIVVFSTYQIVVALGSSPYDPSNFSPTFNPMIVRWSDQGLAYEWTPTTFNQSGEDILSSGSYIVGGVATRQELLIWTDKALYSMQYVGAPYTFNIQILMDNISIMSPNAMITVNNVTYWMGVDRFYQYSGTVQPIPCTVRGYIFNNFNTTQSFQVVCGHNEAYTEIWWFYPSTNSTCNDSYVIFNYSENTWYYGTLNRTAWYDTPLNPNPFGAYSVQNTYLSADIASGVTNLPVINSYSYPKSGTVTVGSETLAYNGNTGVNLVLTSATTASHSQYDAVTNSVPNGVLSHEVGTDDGSVTPSLPISAYIETADMDLGDGDHFAFVWRMLPDMTFSGSSAANSPEVTLTLKPRENPGSSYTITSQDYAPVDSTQLPPTPPATTPTEQYTGQIYVRVRARQMALRVESSKLGTAWQLGAMRYDVRPDGRR